jgi:uncharacterized membrane protein
VTRRRLSAGPVLAGVGVMILGVLSRVAVFRYGGPQSQGPFNAYLFAHGWWSYTDIASLWFRDHMWRQPVPYLDYPLEYPVVTGAVIGLIGNLTTTLSAYFLETAAVLVAAAAALLVLVQRIEGSRVWLLALSPALLLFGVSNWDLIALVPTVAALLLYLRHRDIWASALLAVAASAKLFPLLLLPFVVLVLLIERRWQTALRSIGVFVGVTLLINLPVALHNVHGSVAIRQNWSWFFRYNQSRPAEVSVWRFVGHGLHTGQVNQISELLAGALLVGLLVVAGRRFRAERSRLLLAPAFGAALAGSLFLNKIYSPQYSLWLITALALAGAPWALALVLGAADVAYDYASFHLFAIHTQPAHHNFYENVLLPMGAVHEAVVLAVFGWCLVRLSRSSARHAVGSWEGTSIASGSRSEKALSSRSERI